MANILLVDDDEQLLQQMLRDFRASGHACLGETSGEKALAQIDRAPVDVLVLDVMLPGVSGFEVCRKVRANSQHFSLPILLLSAMSSEEEISHGLAQGADDYLTKPFRFDMLLRRVENLLNQQAYVLANDPTTSLLSAKAIKLEVQRVVNLRQPFQLAYIEFLNITEFGRIVGEEERLKAVRHLARVITGLGEQLRHADFRVGHLGSGHFLCILPPGAAESFSMAVSKAWRNHLPEFYASIGRANAFATAQSGGATTARQNTIPVVDSSFFVTSYGGNSAISFRELFETISRLRQSSLGRGPGIYVDRRG